MKVRKETETGDMIFGNSENNYYADIPEAPAVCIKNRLNLILGSWFLDLREGVDYQAIINYKFQKNVDVILQNRILGTQGVLAITDYSSSYDADKRKMIVDLTVQTIYGNISLGV